MTIADRLRPVLLRLSRELRREIHSLGVTGGQVTLLIQIKKSPGITATIKSAAQNHKTLPPCSPLMIPKTPAIAASWYASAGRTAAARPASLASSPDC